MKKVDLTQGNVLSVIAALAIPIVGSSLLQFTYNIVDMLWVGGLGSNAVASVGSSSFFTGLGYSINTLVVIGAGIKVSHALGRNELYFSYFICYYAFICRKVFYRIFKTRESSSRE